MRPPVLSSTADGGHSGIKSVHAYDIPLSLHQLECAHLPAGVSLYERDGRLILCAKGMELTWDFRDMLPRLSPEKLMRELLVRAVCGRRNATDLTCVDATAGLGEDAFLLAAAGCKVLLCERDPICLLLLKDALSCAVKMPALASAAARMVLYEQDSREMLANLDFAPDVIYVDPMFPKRQKAAAVKKKLQLLQELEAPCDEEEATLLLRAALAAHPQKIVVKRPAKGPYLAAIRPNYSLTGKTVRFDVILPASSQHTSSLS